MPQSPRARGVLFDLDGTLLDTAPDLTGALNALRAEHGLPALADGHLVPTASHGSIAMIRRGFDLQPADPRFAPLQQRFLQLYQARISHASRAFAGIDELLEFLEARRIPWGVVTNKPSRLTEPLLAALGYARRAGCIVSGDTLAVGKPDPLPILHACEQLGLAPADCLMIGDAERDIQAGRRAGTLTLVALFGYISGEDRPQRWGADGLIGHPRETLRWLDPALTGRQAPDRSLSATAG